MRRLIVALPFLFSLTVAAQPYVRAGMAVEDGARVTVRDVDCGSSEPPALFGCGTGVDGLPFGARGNVGQGVTFDAALGRQAGRWRAELAFASRGGAELSAAANFTGVAGAQPVSARVRSLSLMLAGAADFAPAAWRVRPFVTGAAGIAHNTAEPMTFSFPGIGPQARTTTSGATARGFAWSAGAGLTIRLAHGLSVDVTARYSDLGDVRGSGGEAAIVRPTRTVLLDIAPTEMQWPTRGVAVSVRQSF